MRWLRSWLFGMAQLQTRPRSRPGRRPGSPPTKSRVAFTFAIRCRRRPRIAWRRMSCERNMATAAPIDLHYRVDGPSGAPVLVLAHALGLSMAMWDPQVAPLSREFRVLRYDHRGHGGSPVPDGPYRIDDLGRDLLHLRDHLPRIAASTLVMAGAEDQATPLEHAEEIARRIPAAELVVIPDAAHLANIEQPDAVADRILDHVRRSFERPPPV